MTYPLSKQVSSFASEGRVFGEVMRQSVAAVILSGVFVIDILVHVVVITCLFILILGVPVIHLLHEVVARDLEDSLVYVLPDYVMLLPA